jgi:DNA uptake protein ComE-like DNA-binding protein
MGAAVIAMRAIAAPDPSSAAATADTVAGVPAPHAQAGTLSSTMLQRQRPMAVEHYVDLNSAGSKELMTLPGIGADEAGRIIANRPYLSKTDLVTKNVLPVGPFLSVKNLVVAMPRTAPKDKH